MRYGLKKSLSRLFTRLDWGLPAAETSAGFRARFMVFVGLNAAERVWAVWRPSMALDSQMSLLRLWMFRPRSCISWCSATARRLQKRERAVDQLDRYAHRTGPHCSINTPKADFVQTCIYTLVLMSKKRKLASLKMPIKTCIT